MRAETQNLVEADPLALPVPAHSWPKTHRSTLFWA